MISIDFNAPRKVEAQLAEYVDAARALAANSGTEPPSNNSRLAVIHMRFSSGRLRLRLRGHRFAQRRNPLVAIIDLALPDTDGLELLARLRELRPGMEVVVLNQNKPISSFLNSRPAANTRFLTGIVTVEERLDQTGSNHFG